MNEKILLFSGGIDSYIAWYYLNRPKTVYFNLKTPYSDYEIRVIQELIPNTIIDNSLNLDSRQTINSDTAFIPMRNLYLAMLACKYGDEIIICGLEDDCVDDKTPEAFARFSDLLSDFNDRRIRVTSPFWEMSKADIVKWYLETHHNDATKLLETISCYSPDLQDGTDIKRYCGQCRCCFRKWNALYVNGIELPFHNIGVMKEYLVKARQDYYIPKRNASIIKAVTNYAEKSEFSYLGKVCRVDIDGILTVETEGHDYENRTPDRDNISKVNLLCEQGAIIILWTSRYPEDQKVTEEWLGRHGVWYDRLEFGKPQYDGIIDDKVINLNEVEFRGD